MNLKSRILDRTVFVTGADGFIGSHLVDRLVELGADVHVFVRATSSGELNNIRHQSDEITVHRGDLRDKHSVDQALSPLKGHSDLIIFHLAAQAHVGESWERPYETVDTNVIGTLNLLQSIVDLISTLRSSTLLAQVRNMGTLKKRCLRNTSLMMTTVFFSVNDHQ
jgi:dTDP-glucose 4,6-dehydratase